MKQLSLIALVLLSFNSHALREMNQPVYTGVQSMLINTLAEGIIHGEMKCSYQIIATEDIYIEHMKVPKSKKDSDRFRMEIVNLSSNNLEVTDKTYEIKMISYYPLDEKFVESTFSFNDKERKAMGIKNEVYPISSLDSGQRSTLDNIKSKISKNKMCQGVI